MKIEGVKMKAEVKRRTEPLFASVNFPLFNGRFDNQGNPPEDDKNISQSGDSTGGIRNYKPLNAYPSGPSITINNYNYNSPPPIMAAAPTPNNTTAFTIGAAVVAGNVVGGKVNRFLADYDRLTKMAAAAPPGPGPDETQDLLFKRKVGLSILWNVLKLESAFKEIVGGARYGFYWSWGWGVGEI
ncbi:hypothetical protein LXL04_026128 [Taraxacum kok-saghyz]